jgi:Sulfatase/Type I phosphodiesterase / nucleotide pyrophosphatase
VRTRNALLALVGSIGLVGSMSAVPAVQADPPDRPTRVLIIVLDQTRQDTIARYDMQTVRDLMNQGVSFPNAYLGHMAAETVISHNVITSGLLPKNMGWSNEVHRDVGNVTGRGEGAYQVTSSMSCSEFDALIGAGGYLKLQDYLDEEFGENSVFGSIAEKRTAACTGGHTAGTDSDHFIFQIRGNSAPAGTVCDGIAGPWRIPEAINVPAYIDLSMCSRYWTRQSTSPPLDYGTASLPPAWMYPLEGNRFAPGFDPGHIGGDTWSADAAIEVIENDPHWRGMLVSLGAIDKMGHMWGTNDTGEPGAAAGSVEEMRHLPFIAKLADQQVGRILDALDVAGQLDETLVVITADHGAQTGKRFHGINEPFRSDFNWYCGRETTSSPETYLSPSPAIASLAANLGGDCDATTAAGNIAFTYQDAHIAVWLNGTSLAALQQAAAAVRQLPDVVATYYRDGDHYVRHGSLAPMPGGERGWFNRHGQELVDTMAAPFGPDVVGLLRNDVTYGVYGDHGGHQQQVQNIPIIFAGPGLEAGVTPSVEMRSVDILPTILSVMGISFDASTMDGTAVPIPLG